MKIELKTLGVEFTFDSQIKENAKKVAFYKELYGHKTSSHKGKYLYIKEGILSNIKFLKPTRSTLIIKLKDSKTIKNFLKKNNAKFNEKIVLLNENEAKSLGLHHPNNWKKIYEDIKGNENLLLTIDF